MNHMLYHLIVLYGIHILIDTEFDNFSYTINFIAETNETEHVMDNRNIQTNRLSTKTTSYENRNLTQTVHLFLLHHSKLWHYGKCHQWQQLTYLRYYGERSTS